MKLLLDTHIALWAISDSKRLNEVVRGLLENEEFDRLLLAQAKSEGYRFMTHDSLITGYNEPCLFVV